MSPVVVKDHSVVFPDSQQPSAQYLEQGWTDEREIGQLLLQGNRPCIQNKYCTQKTSLSHLIVNLEFLHHAQLHKHSQSSCNHGINVQRKVVEGQLINAQLTNQRNVSSLDGTKREEREDSEDVLDYTHVPYQILPHLNSSTA